MRVLVKFDALADLGPVDDHYSFSEIYNLIFLLFLLIETGGKKIKTKRRGKNVWKSLVDYQFDLIFFIIFFDPSFLYGWIQSSTWEKSIFLFSSRMGNDRVLGHHNESRCHTLKVNKLATHKSQVVHTCGSTPGISTEEVFSLSPSGVTSVAIATIAIRVLISLIGIIHRKKVIIKNTLFFSLTKERKMYRRSRWRGEKRKMRENERKKKLWLNGSIFIQCHFSSVFWFLLPLKYIAKARAGRLPCTRRQSAHIHRHRINWQQLKSS